jgi:hypothetical protein
MQSHHPSFLKALLILSPVLLLFTGCGVTAERNVQAFNACLTRHPQDAPLCEAPRQAYDLDLVTVAARSMPELGIRQ